MEPEVTTQEVEEEEIQTTQESEEESEATTQTTAEEKSPTVEDIVSGKQAIGKKGVDTTPKWLKNRLDEMTAKLYEKDKRIKELEATKIITSERPLPPLRDDFIEPEVFRKAMVKYEDDLDDWKTQHRDIAISQERQKQEIADNTAKFNEKAEKMREKYTDFDIIINEPVFSPAMSTEILTSDFGPEIAYFLAKNPAEALKLSKLAPNRVAREVGKLEAKFSQASKKIISNAPEAIKPIKGLNVVQKDPEKMNTQEWMAWEKRRIIEKRKQMGGLT